MSNFKISYQVSHFARAFYASHILRVGGKAYYFQDEKSMHESVSMLKDVVTMLGGEAVEGDGESPPDESKEKPDHP